MPETLNNRLLAIEKRLDDLMASLACEELAFTVFPQPIDLSQTWHPALIKRVGSAIGVEARSYYQAKIELPPPNIRENVRWG